MDDNNKIIDKIEKLISLSGSSNENEARAAMLKAQELMAKYEIDREQVEGRETERPVVGFTSSPYREEWIHMVSATIAENFRCRSISIARNNSGGSFRIRFYGYEEDAEICINIFNYAIKVIRKKFMTLRAIYAEAQKEFGKTEKSNYVIGFCYGLEKNFDEQKKQSQSFALALVTPKAVDDFVRSLPGIETRQSPVNIARSRDAALLQRTGYVDGKTFRNAGGAARLGN
ncbi:MAG: DUF2786 domain-containing protein [Eubacterium sp.]|nr:DUF2786 domain-containing protein [Eubacterium sp.]